MGKTISIVFIIYKSIVNLYNCWFSVKIRVIPLNEERLPVAKPVLIDVKVI